MFQIRKKFHQNLNIYAVMKMCLALTLEAMLLATMSYHVSIWQNLFESMCN